VVTTVLLALSLTLRDVMHTVSAAVRFSYSQVLGVPRLLQALDCDRLVQRQIFVHSYWQFLLHQEVPSLYLCRLTLRVCARSGVMVAYLFFKNSGNMESKSEDGAGAILRTNCLRFVGVFSYRYIRSDLSLCHTHTHTHTHTHIFFPRTVCTLSSEVLILICQYVVNCVVLMDNA
jgi:hypothetical protein